MSNSKIDRRVKYTKMVLRQSLLELMKSKPIDKITVKEICELADINRGTFYSHYSEPRALLEQIQNELFNDIKATLDKYLTNADPTSGAYEMVLEIIKCIESNSDICKILLGEHGDSDFLKRIIDLAYEKSRESWSLSMKVKDEKLIEYFYGFVSSGSIGAIQLWIQSGMVEPPEMLATVIDELTSQGLKIFF
ncbi:MAG TPA: TetR/AcrR family transcriptional regulator [Clostridiales bacterium]|jgi:AcrR family transcriptional regulator|nr:TetR/AcrR family transcriptional regulator [Clostridiales bacterium]